MRHQINPRLLDSWGVSQGFLNMVLATGARHPQNRKRERFCRVRGHECIRSDQLCDDGVLGNEAAQDEAESPVLDSRYAV
jgi:hypothetical protein